MVVRRRSWAVLGGLVVVATLSGLLAPSAGAQPTKTDPSPLKQVVKIKFAALPALSTAAAYIAQAKGFFKAENLDVELVNGGAFTAVQPLLATGRIDAAYGAAAVSTFNGIANGLDIQLVAGGGYPQKGNPPVALLTLKSGPVKSLTDLRGKTVGAPGGLNSASGYYINELLKQANMTPSDLRIVDLSASDGLAALQNGAVSAAISSGTIMTQLLKDGTHVSLGDMDKVVARGVAGAYVFGPTLLRKNRQAGVAFLRAMIKATRVYLQTDLRKNKEIVQILSKATGSPTWVIKADVPPVFDPNLNLRTDVYTAFQVFYRDLKVLNYAPLLKKDRLIDEDMLKAALATVK